MRFELHSNSTNEKNVIYVNILDDNGKVIGNTLIRSFTFRTLPHLHEQMKHEHKCTKVACLEAVRHIAAPGTIAYVGIIELDHRERGKRYGPQVLQYIPQICTQFNLPTPNAVCAYILPNSYKLDLETYQHEPISKKERHQMYKTMHKTFRRAGYKRTHVLKPRVVVKRTVNA